MKTISVQYSGNNPQSSCNVQIIEVTELKIDPPCRDFDFRIQLDQGASVNFYLGANPEYLTIGQARSVTADDLPTLRQQVKSGVVSAPQPQRSANRLRWMALGLGALAIVIGMLYRMRNKAQR
ncbi:MAG: hypothetical protein HZA46_12750 [Planctomycetales bacterium]|nr:hypothetical protein [Planctomycetales bacterium]